jgi:AraC-like DNA-binding protein
MMSLHGMRLSLRSYGERVVSHVHDYHQIVLPVTGVLDQQIGGSDGAISTRRFAVIGAGVAHAFRASGPNRFVVLDAGAPVAGPGGVFRPLDGPLTELVRYAAAELAMAPLPARLEFHLTALLAGRLQRTGAPLPHDPVEAALAVMAARYAEDLRINALAAAAGLGTSHFHALFRQKTGLTPAAMLANMRLDAADHLLRRTTRPIAEIALMVGFSDQTALTRCFRRRRGITPYAVRVMGGEGQGLRPWTPPEDGHPLDT